MLYVMYGFILFAWFFTTGIGIYLLYKKRELSEMARVLWALIIILFPYIGPTIFALVTYNQKKNNLDNKASRSKPGF